MTGKLAKSILSDLDKLTLQWRARSCESCKYSSGSPNDFLRCRALPPVPDSNGWGVFPLVEAADWCGRFIPRKINNMEDDDAGK